ncbi:MAG: endonuclease/exonuclease/phosphatase family protein [Alphaproteobacteria bacterium]|nr:endonuclease/exonuclease/phosphatase family protein [Alphaproteobacteria bacterium]
MAGLFSGFWWLLDLLNHFRPLATLSATILALPFLVRKEKTYIALAGIIVILNAGLMTHRVMQFGAPPTSLHSKNSISVLTANVLTRNRNHHAVLSMVQEHDPDIFVAIETNETWHKKLAPLHTLYPYRLLHPRPDNFGMAIYAKEPFAKELMTTEISHLPLIKLSFKTFTLLAAHPLPPVSQKYAASLNAYMHAIRQHTQNERKPLIVAGDLNTTLWSDNIRPLLETGLQPTNIWGWTWPTFMPLLALQIDHIFVKDMAVHSFDRLDRIGSDHFPILVTLTPLFP